MDVKMDGNSLNASLQAWYFLQLQRLALPDPENISECYDKELFYD